MVGVSTKRKVNMSKVFKLIMSACEKEKARGEDQLWLDISEVRLQIHNWWLKNLMVTGQREAIIPDNLVNSTKLIIGQLNLKGPNLQQLAMFKLMYSAHAENLKNNYIFMKELDKRGDLQKLKDMHDEKPQRFKLDKRTKRWLEGSKTISELFRDAGKTQMLVDLCQGREHPDAFVAVRPGDIQYLPR